MRYKSLCLIIALMLTLSASLYSSPMKINASEYNYARILSEDVELYSDALGQKTLFILPYSYYVKVLTLGLTYSKIAYAPYGENLSVPYYVKTENLTFVDYTPEAPYPSLQLVTSYTTSLFFDNTTKNVSKSIAEQEKMLFCGELSVGNVELVYVWCNGDFGYVKKNTLLGFTLPLNTDVIITESESTQSEISSEPLSSDSDSEKNEDIKRVAIVLFTCIGAISIVYFIFVPSKKRPVELTTLDTDDMN